jgi:hypothetical protein
MACWNSSAEMVPRSGGSASFASSAAVLAVRRSGGLDDVLPKRLLAAAGLSHRPRVHRATARDQVGAGAQPRHHDQQQRPDRFARARRLVIPQGHAEAPHVRPCARRVATVRNMVGQRRPLGITRDG